MLVKVKVRTPTLLRFTVLATPSFTKIFTRLLWHIPDLGRVEGVLSELLNRKKKEKDNNARGKKEEVGGKRSL